MMSTFKDLSKWIQYNNFQTQHISLWKLFHDSKKTILPYISTFWWNSWPTSTVKIIELTQKFIQVFLYHLTKKPKWVLLAKPIHSSYTMAESTEDYFPLWKWVLTTLVEYFIVYISPRVSQGWCIQGTDYLVGNLPTIAQLVHSWETFKSRSDCISNSLFTKTNNRGKYPLPCQLLINTG